MRKTLMAALIGGAFAFGGQAHAGLTLDLNGSAAGGVIFADALDWAPTSFLAQGGNRAIANFQSQATNPNACDNGACSFEVLTHAKLTAYAPAGGGSFIGLPNFGGETVVSAGNAGTPAIPRPFAGFESTGAGWLEFYFSPTGASDANDLTGSGFNAGRLIGRLEGVNIGAFGSFTVTGGPVALDGSGDGNQFGAQQTVTGTGSQEALRAGTTSVTLDSDFFLTEIADFTIQYENISIGLPYTSVNPSDCFNDSSRTNGDVGSSGFASTCNTTHVNGAYSAQNAGDPGYLPNVGAVNGLGLGSPDFVAQTDYNSSVTGTVPEPGSLALVGLALASLGFAATRRRRG
jgi:hypothetical protein